jgi:PAS domain S-box-containing protein
VKEIDDLQYKFAFDEMVDAIVIADETSARIVDVNKSCCQLLGYGKTELVGHNVSLLFNNNSIDELTKPHPENFMFGNVIPNRNLKTKDGTSIPVDLTISTFGSQSANYVMISVRDIKERLKYEKEIVQMNEELREVNASKDKLFSIIAHDLKNPLMALMGLSEIMFEDGAENSIEETRETASTINKLSKDTYDLLDNLLNWAQVQTRKISAEKKEVHLFNIADKIIDTLGPSARLKKVGLVNSVSPEFVLNADENMIKTIIRNLVANSIKFSLADTHITIRAFSKDGMNTVIVEDQGIGMEESYVANLFKVNILTSRYGTNKEKGTGLGLLLCHEFIRLHNGDIKVISEIGKGSQFIIRLPE